MGVGNHAHLVNQVTDKTSVPNLAMGVTGHKHESKKLHFHAWLNLNGDFRTSTHSSREEANNLRNETIKQMRAKGMY